MVLIVRPKAWNTSTVIRIEIGMAVSEMNVARTFIRNRNRMTATTTAASSSTRFDVADRGLDEGRLPELDVGGRDARAAACAGCLPERASISARQRDRVGAGLLLDGDDDGGLALVARIAALDAGGEVHGRHLLAAG